MSVIPGLLLIGEGHRVGYLFIPFFRSLWALYHQLWSRAYAFLLLPSHAVSVRQWVRGNNAAPSAWTPLGLGPLWAIGVGSPPANPLQGPVGLDITLVRIVSCCPLQA